MYRHNRSLDVRYIGLAGSPTGSAAKEPVSGYAESKTIKRQLGFSPLWRDWGAGGETSAALYSRAVAAFLLRSACVFGLIACRRAEDRLGVTP